MESNKRLKEGLARARESEAAAIMDQAHLTRTYTEALADIRRLEADLARVGERLCNEISDNTKLREDLAREKERGNWQRCALRDALAVLPDSRHGDDESWRWCWEELSGDAQDEVKRVRDIARRVLEETP